jgi:Zn-dependent M16 (insulinase) family peptidase
MVFITGEDKELNLLKENMNKVVDVLSTQSLTNNEYKFNEEQKNEGLMTPANVDYVAKGYNFKKLGYNYSGSILVLKTILGYDYLWNRVRVKGGAYGCMSTIARTGNMAFVSYRDPNLTETLKAYDEAADFIKSFDVSEREMTKYIIGTISNLDMPLTPSSKGEKALGMYMRGITKEDRQRERDEVLSTNVDSIKEYANLIGDIMNKDFICVVGDEKKIKANKDEFKTLINVFN